jgi:hypothetical protein
VYEALDSSVVVSRGMRPRVSVLLRGSLRLYAKDGSSRFIRIRALASNIALCSKESHGSETHDTRVKCHLSENLQSLIFY